MKNFKTIIQIIEDNPKYIYWFIAFLLIPALLINLGMYPFNLDEATRAVVALEMKFSGNFITPTINGEFYYNKPPLFNWIQWVFISIPGSLSEFYFRLPVVLSLIGFGATIYLSLKKELGYKISLFTAFAVITSGRILFYDSFKGLIDISFSWLIYVNFWVIFDNFRKNRFFRLFAISWFLIALGFLLKGLPALVFQGISLFTYFLYKRSFFKLFSIESISGLLFFIVPVGIYLLLYQQENSLNYYIANLWTESAKRTPIENSFFNTIKHIFLFPFEFLYNFAPWTILIFAVFSGKMIRKILTEVSLVYLILVFSANIVIYWISPAIYPRYLFMFLPSLFAVLSYSYFNLNENSILKRYFYQPLGFLVSISLLMLLSIIPFIINRELYNYFWIKYLILVFLTLTLLALFLIFWKERIFIMLGFVILIRIGFNFFAFEERLRTGVDGYQRKDTISAIQLTKGKPLYLYKDCPIHNSSTFYIERERKEILSRWMADLEEGNLFIVRGKDLINLPSYKIITSFETNLGYLKLYVIEAEKRN